MTLSPTTPTSPTSPTHHKRHSLRIPSLQSNNEPMCMPSQSTNGTPETYYYSYHSRRPSGTSIQQPYSPIQTKPRPPSQRSKHPSSSRLSIGSNISAGVASNVGFGPNLADELEDAWDGVEDMEESEDSFLDGLQEGDPNRIAQSPTSIHDMHEFGTEIEPQSPRNSRLSKPPEKPPSPSKQWASMGMHKKTESLYDGSDYGPSSDDEAFDPITPSLQRRIHDVEEIARKSSNADSLDESGGVISRMIAALKEHLGAQSSIENNTTRLVTAYASMATHRSHQTREISASSHGLLSSNSLSGSSLSDLPPELLDLLITEINTLTMTLPFLQASPTTSNSSNPLISLSAFATNTHDLVAILHNLADSLTEHRQHLLTAARHLKQVRDLVEDLRTEEGLVETSMMLIQAGDWDRRCRERHAGKAVGELLEGFKHNWGVDYVDGSWQPAITVQ